MIQQGPVAVRRLVEPGDEMREHLDVILIDLRELGDSLWIFAVMRPTMEPHGRRFALGVRTARKVAGKATLDLRVSMSGASPVTVTVSCTPPGAICRLIAAVRPTSSAIPSRVTVLKPGSSAVIL